jgi:hypothetical protein
LSRVQILSPPLSIYGLRDPDRAIGFDETEPPTVSPSEDTMADRQYTPVRRSIIAAYLVVGIADVVYAYIERRKGLR